MGGGDPAAVPVLLALLADENIIVKNHAAWALARVGPPARAAVPVLKTLARIQPPDMVSMTARDAISFIEPNALKNAGQP